MRELMLSAQIEKLDLVLDFVNCLLEEAGCPKAVQYELDIAVEELFVNVAHYAYTPQVGPVTIQTEIKDDSVSISFIDSGKPYNPWEKEDPDTTLSAEERMIGGLGIYMVKKSMDEVGYVYKDGKNMVTIRKKMTGKG